MRKKLSYFVLLSLLLGFAGCSLHGRQMDPSGGSWKLARYVTSEGYWAPNGVVYYSEKQFPMTPVKDGIFVSTTGFVEELAVVARCHVSLDHCIYSQMEYAMIDKHGAFVVPFGKYYFKNISYIDGQSNAYPLRLVPEPEVIDGYRFPFWAYIDQSSSEKIITSFYKKDRMMVQSPSTHKLGFIDRTGNIAIPLDLLASAPINLNNENTFEVITEDGFGTMDLNGNYTPAKYQCHSTFESEDFTLVNVGGKLKNLKYDERITKDFVVVDTFLDNDYNHSNFCEGGLWGVLDDQGNEIIEPKYESIDILHDSNYILVHNGTNIGYFNKKGKAIILTQYQTIIPGKYFFIVSNGENYGMLDLTGSPLTELKYDNVRLEPDTKVINNSAVVVQKNGKWGLVDAEGKEILPLSFEDMGSPDEGLVAAKLNGRYGVLDFEGNEIAPFIYDSIEPFKSGRARATFANDEVFIYRDKTTKDAWREKLHRANEIHGKPKRIETLQTEEHLNRQVHSAVVPLNEKQSSTENNEQNQDATPELQNAKVESPIETTKPTDNNDKITSAENQTQNTSNSEPIPEENTKSNDIATQTNEPVEKTQTTENPTPSDKTESNISANHNSESSTMPIGQPQPAQNSSKDCSTSSSYTEYQLLKDKVRYQIHTYGILTANSGTPEQFASTYRLIKDYQTLMLGYRNNAKLENCTFSPSEEEVWKP